jgi:hypothetical protein
LKLKSQKTLLNNYKYISSVPTLDDTILTISWINMDMATTNLLGISLRLSDA